MWLGRQVLYFGKFKRMLLSVTLGGLRGKKYWLIPQYIWLWTIPQFLEAMSMNSASNYNYILYGANQEIILIFYIKSCKSFSSIKGNDNRTAVQKLFRFVLGFVLCMLIIIQIQAKMMCTRFTNHDKSKGANSVPQMHLRTWLSSLRCMLASFLPGKDRTFRDTKSW